MVTILVIFQHKAPNWKEKELNTCCDIEDEESLEMPK